MAAIVVSEFMDEAALPALRAAGAVLYDPGLVDRPSELLAAVAEARALVVRNRTQVRGALLAAAGRLEVVGRLGVGLDNIDVEECRRRGIAVHPATGANDVAVAEWVMGAALVLVRGAFGASAEVASGGWPRTRLMGGELMGRTLGLVGFGATAREVAARARAFGMGLAAHDPHLAEGDPAWSGVVRLSLPDLLAVADVVSLHVPLTAETRGMIGAAALAAMRPGAILINAARGGVVDEPALAAALRAGALGGAALDVFAEEPVTAAAGALFAGIPNLILTPHIAGVTVESNVRVSAMVAGRVARHLAR